MSLHRCQKQVIRNSQLSFAKAFLGFPGLSSVDFPIESDRVYSLGWCVWDICFPISPHLKS